MNKVEPIRSKEKIEAMKNELLKSGFRNYFPGAGLPYFKKGGR